MDCISLLIINEILVSDVAHYSCVDICFSTALIISNHHVDIHVSFKITDIIFLQLVRVYNYFSS